ncbi:replication initiation protein [Chondrinema litorale]|uniref:replication initiation protein n=1 Tax=Chondrinema litorale TaxID=2994555 RepID=UPI002542E9A4|nr:replication initiation protein [Chondrinema litorale]UZS00161.1 replication initiation protein [Chondrinema litorale]
MPSIEKNKQLKQSNLITSSRYSMTAVEMNIIFLLIAQLKKDDPVDKVYQISVKELEAAAGSKINYGRLKDYTFKLRNRGYEIENKEGYLQIGICASVEYIRQSGVLEIEIARKLRPFLFDLKDNFTTYSLKNALKVRGTYAKRLFQMFCMWQSTGKFLIKIEELKYKLDLINRVTGEEKYEKYGMFKKKVIDVALREINENTDFDIEFEEIKTGRKITTFVFFIKLKESASLIAKF